MAYGLADRGGYNYKFVEPPPDRLVCKICFLPCREARLTSCGHYYCESCLRQLQSSTTVSHACPVCREEQFEVYPQIEADREIKGLRVYCLNQEKGCGWIGQLSVLIERELSPRDKPIPECMRCEKCNEVIHYTNLTSHFTSNCPCYCQYCKITAERKVIDNLHKEKCHKYPLPCPNKCGLDEIPRDGMDEYKAECPLEVIQCRHCKAEITHKSKENHNNENKIEHLQMMCDEKFKSACNERQEISGSVKGIKQEVAQLIDTMSSGSTSSKVNNDLLTQPTVIKPKLIVAVLSGLCVLIAILVMIFQSAYNTSEMQQQIVGILDLLKMEQNVTCKDSLTQTKIHLNELEETVKTCKNKLQQAKSVQTELQKDLKSMRKSILEVNVTTKPTTGSKSEHDELQTELSKLNYLWSLAMSIYKSCKNLYNHMGSRILWSEMIFLCDEMSLQGNQVTPVVVKMSNYTEKMKSKTQWYSSPFFTFEKGYKVQIRVEPAVYGDGEITHDHVFVYLLLLKGPYDDKLIKRSIKGTFTVELLNQLNDTIHRSSEMAFICNGMVCNFKAAKLYSRGGRLTAHETICYQITSGYLQNDSLYFRISYKNDNYYLYYLRKYFLVPTAAVVTASFVITVVEKKLKFGANIIFATLLIIGSVITGNLLGGVLWVAVTYHISPLIMNTLRKYIRSPNTSPPPSCRREQQEEQGHSKLRIPPEVVGLCLRLCLESVFSILANILVVYVLSMPWNIIWLIV